MISKQTSPQRAFRALADPTRRQILNYLVEGEMTIGQVCERFDMTRGAVKKHLVILQEGNLIEVTARGRERINRINRSGFKPVSDWMHFFDQFWVARLGNLKSAIEKETRKRKNT